MKGALKKLRYRVNLVNEWIAVHATLIFGTMWMTYLFFLYGFIPVIFPKYMDQLLYWSNTVQLWSLPLLMVGQNILGRSAEKRAQQDHEMIMAEFKTLKDMHKAQAEELQQLRQVNTELHLLLEREGLLNGRNGKETHHGKKPQGDRHHS